MLKRCLLPLLTLLCTFTLTAHAGLFKKDITMIVVPREAKPIQFAQDISRRYPTLIVSYQLENELLKIHAWNGENWVEISTEDYVTGAFFENPPSHAILVESADSPAPEILIPDGTWCASGNLLRSTEPHVMIHLLGRYFDFPYLTWKQFSRRYNEPMARINPALINLYWWNLYGEDLLDKRDQLNPEQDLDKWLFLDIIPPPPIEPVVIEEEPNVVEPAEIPATEKIEEIVIEEPIEESLSEVIAEPAATASTNIQAEVVEEKSEATETVESIIDSMKAAAQPEVDPFTTDNIPAAKVVLPAE